MKLFDKKVTIVTDVRRALEDRILVCDLPDGRVIEFNPEEEDRLVYPDLENYTDCTWVESLDEYDNMWDSELPESVKGVIKDHFPEGTFFYITYI